MAYSNNMGFWGKPSPQHISLVYGIRTIIWSGFKWFMRIVVWCMTLEGSPNWFHRLKNSQPHFSKKLSWLKKSHDASCILTVEHSYWSDWQLSSWEFAREKSLLVVPLSVLQENFSLHLFNHDNSLLTSAHTCRRLIALAVHLSVAKQSVMIYLSFFYSPTFLYRPSTCSVQQKTSVCYQICLCLTQYSISVPCASKRCMAAVDFSTARMMHRLLTATAATYDCDATLSIKFLPISLSEL